MSHLYLLSVVLDGPYGRHWLHYGIPLPHPGNGRLAEEESQAMLYCLSRLMPITKNIPITPL